MGEVIQMRPTMPEGEVLLTFAEVRQRCKELLGTEAGEQRMQRAPYLPLQDAWQPRRWALSTIDAWISQAPQGR